jgi:ketosteroid isomerase-like protein
MRHAICGVLFLSFLLAGSAQAADSETAAIRATIEKAYQNWGALNPDANDALYSAQADIAWYDISPMQYKGWASYKDGAKKVLDGFKDLKFTIGDDFAVTRVGKVAWVTFTWKGVAHLKGGKEMVLEGRATEILQKQKGNWIIVHEHVSLPAPL